MDASYKKLLFFVHINVSLIIIVLSAQVVARQLFGSLD